MRGKVAVCRPVVWLEHACHGWVLLLLYSPGGLPESFIRRCLAGGCIITEDKREDFVDDPSTGIIPVSRRQGSKVRQDRTDLLRCSRREV